MGALDHLRGMTHDQIREYVRTRSLEASSIRFDNPFDPEGYTTLIVRWPNGMMLWNEICKRCAAVVEDRAVHDEFHALLPAPRLASA